MSDTKGKVGRALRLLASKGWVDQDPDVVAELLEAAHHVATLVVADEGASPEVRSVARDFLDRLRSDTH